MAVFDGAPWVGGAIESLLAQTLPRYWPPSLIRDCAWSGARVPG